MGVKSKRLLLSHDGNPMVTGTMIKLLEGIVILVANWALKVFISSAVCTCISLLSLSCNTLSGPHVIPN